MNPGSSLKWRCRRGIREMDLLLQRFVELRYDSLTTEEKNTFAELLDHPDLDIMDWIMERKYPPTEPINSLVLQIRNINYHTLNT